MSTRSRRTVRYSNPPGNSIPLTGMDDPTDSFLDKPDRESSPERRGPRNRKWRKIDFSPLIFSGRTIYLRKADSWINASQILGLAGYSYDSYPLDWSAQRFEHELVTGAVPREDMYPWKSASSSANATYLNGLPS